MRGYDVWWESQVSYDGGRAWQKWQEHWGEEGAFAYACLSKAEIEPLSQFRVVKATRHKRDGKRDLIKRAPCDPPPLTFHGVPCDRIGNGGKHR